MFYDMLKDKKYKNMLEIFDIDFKDHNDVIKKL